MRSSGESNLIRGAISRYQWMIPLIILLWPALPAIAHVGSPDIYADGSAGPYRLFVTIRPPQVIPGVAEIEVRAEGADAGITGVDIAPIPLTGEASKHPPVADAMKQSASDKQFFTGALWIMASGSWQVRFRVQGSQGPGVLSIPVPATSSSTKGMQAGLGILLSVLGIILVLGVIGIVGAAARDSQLPPGASASPASRKRAAVAMAVALVIMVGAVVFGDLWWNVEASDYAHYVYKPLNMNATVSVDHVLDLKIQDPGWLKSRKIDDFVLDHEHLMHLYLLREPGLDFVYHLHPDHIAPGEFTLGLPSVPAGSYRLYADVVHASGFPETLVASLSLPDTTGRALDGDDAKGIAQPIAAVSAKTCKSTSSNNTSFRLPDGYTMVWNNPESMAAKTPEIFEFMLLDPAGNVPSDMSLYMGMVGHAAFVKDDGSVFAHVHPSGTISMAALMMAAKQNEPAGSTRPDAMNTMRGMVSTSTKTAVIQSPIVGAVPNHVGFPYGFPTPGPYRIFVQMKHGGTIETAAFDACAR